MGLQSTITEEIKKAMKSKDTLKLSVLRMLKSAIKNKEIEVKKELTDTEILSVISKMCKQREDSVEQFKKGGRDDLVENESKEIVILTAYLPEPMTEAEIGTMVKEIISEMGATSMRDMGTVMKAAAAQAKGKADGKVLSITVKRLLS